MKSLLTMLPFVVVLSVGCGRERQDNPRELAPLNGSWKGRHVTRIERPFSELVLFARRPDSSLALSLKYENGPRSRIWIDDGAWKGQRVVSEKWIKESTRERLEFGNLFSKWGYGYHWMQKQISFGDRKIASYFVPGDGNQILALFPKLEMVVVFTAGNYGKDPKPIYHSLFENFIVPAALQQQ